MLRDVLGSSLTDGQYGFRTKFDLQNASSSELTAFANGCLRDACEGQHLGCWEAKQQPKTMRAYALRFAGQTVAGKGPKEDLLQVELPDPMNTRGTCVACKQSPLPSCLFGWAEVAELEGTSQGVASREPQARVSPKAEVRGVTQVRTIRAYMRKDPAQEPSGLPSGLKAEDSAEGWGRRASAMAC